MSKLRDRIADTLADDPTIHLREDGYTADDVLRMADVLMTALHLHEERGRLRVVRYVSDWEVVDDNT